MQSALVKSRICLQRAEHMLGSAFVKCDLTYPQTPVNRCIVFSGELSAPNTTLLPDLNRLNLLIFWSSNALHLQLVNCLNRTGLPAIVMAAYGRIEMYLKAMPDNPRHNTLLMDYKAQGTPGAVMQKYGPSGGYVDLACEHHCISTSITTLGGYSAHADQLDLLNFVSGVAQWPEQTRLVRSGISAKEALAAQLQLLNGPRNLALDLWISAS